MTPLKGICIYAAGGEAVVAFFTSSGRRRVASGK